MVHHIGSIICDGKYYTVVYHIRAYFSVRGQRHCIGALSQRIFGKNFLIICLMKITYLVNQYSEQKEYIFEVFVPYLDYTCKAATIR